MVARKYEARRKKSNRYMGIGNFSLVYTERSDPCRGLGMRHDGISTERQAITNEKILCSFEFRSIVAIISRLESVNQLGTGITANDHTGNGPEVK